MLAYLNNLQDVIVGLGLIGMALCGLLWIAAYNRFVSTPEGSDRWKLAVMNQWFHARWFLGIGAVVGIFWAIPDVDYDKQIIYRDRIVTKNVPGPAQIKEKTGTLVYKELIDKCMGGNSASNYPETYETCHRLSLQTLLASGYVKNNHKYEELFKWCNEKFSLDNVPNETVGQIRNERIRLCESAAEKALTS